MPFGPDPKWGNPTNWWEGSAVDPFREMDPFRAKTPFHRDFMGLLRQGEKVRPGIESGNKYERSKFDEKNNYLRTRSSGFNHPPNLADDGSPAYPPKRDPYYLEKQDAHLLAGANKFIPKLKDLGVDLNPVERQGLLTYINHRYGAAPRDARLNRFGLEGDIAMQTLRDKYNPEDLVDKLIGLANVAQNTDDYEADKRRKK